VVSKRGSCSRRCGVVRILGHGTAVSRASRWPLTSCCSGLRPAGLPLNSGRYAPGAWRLRKVRGLPGRETRRSVRVAAGRGISSGESATVAQGMFRDPARGGQQRGSRAHRLWRLSASVSVLTQVIPIVRACRGRRQASGWSSLARAFAQRPCAQHCLAADARLRPARHEQSSMNFNLQRPPRRAPLKASFGPMPECAVILLPSGGCQ
jgi:hypothetical protein